MVQELLLNTTTDVNSTWYSFKTNTLKIIDMLLTNFNSVVIIYSGSTTTSKYRFVLIRPKSPVNKRTGKHSENKTKFPLVMTMLNIIMPSSTTKNK